MRVVSGCNVGGSGGESVTRARVVETFLLRPLGLRKKTIQEFTGGDESMSPLQSWQKEAGSDVSSKQRGSKSSARERTQTNGRGANFSTPRRNKRGVVC